MEITVSEIAQQIYSVRGAKVILDRNLAKFCETKTSTLNQSVNRNSQLFKKGAVFKLTQDEYDDLKMKHASLEQGEKMGGHRKLPLAFTGLGVAMIASLLRSERAIDISRLVFDALFQVPESQKPFSENEALKILDQKLDQLISYVKSQPPAGPTPNLAQAQNPKFSITPTSHLEKIRTIQEAVATYFKLKPNELNNSSRTKNVALARQIAIYLVKTNTQLGLKEIAKHFGGRNHTTVLHAYRKISKTVRTDAVTAQAVQDLEMILTQEKPSSLLRLS